MKTLRDFEHAGWEAAAASYGDSFASVTQLFADALLDAARVTERQKVLDVGCGTGVVTAAAVARGADCVGIAFSGAMIIEARARNPKLAFQQASAEQMPFGDATFDAVVSNVGIQHVEHPQIALAEAMRVLRTGGYLAFTVWEKPDNNPGWGILNAAIRAHGNLDVSMPAGNSALVGAPQLAEALAVVGFANVMRVTVERPWRLPRGTHLMEIFTSGTVRNAHLIRQQTPAAVAAIRAAMDAALAPYTKDGDVEIPARAVLILGDKPAA
jgi:ubiquinone/menaquinone biosynthesis C-methylase UbiE